jgi:hypothetical protein
MPTLLFFVQQCLQIVRAAGTLRPHLLAVCTEGTFNVLKYLWYIDETQQKETRPTMDGWHPTFFGHRTHLVLSYMYIGLAEPT